MPTTKQPRKRKRPLSNSYLNGLPLWKLLSIAMVDLGKQEKAKRSEVCMDDWLSRNGVCRACLAGSVMRWSCLMTMAQWRRHTADWPFAIDNLRQGRVVSAAGILGRFGREYQPFVREITDYHDGHDGHEGFWRDITKLRDDLKKAGL